MLAAYRINIALLSIGVGMVVGILSLLITLTHSIATVSAAAPAPSAGKVSGTNATRGTAWTSLPGRLAAPDCGPNWTTVTSPNQGTATDYLFGVAVAGSNDVWAVGYYQNATSSDQTLIEHWNGSAWSIVPSPNPGTDFNDLYGVAVAGPNDVWAVGDYQNLSGEHTLIEHWNGSVWSVVPSPGSPVLYGVAVAGPNDVWAVGTGYANTLIEHWNDSAWSIVSSPNPGTNNNYLYGVAVAGPNDVWAVGFYNNSGTPYQTLIEHWNGSTWSIVSSPNPGTYSNYLFGVAVAGPNDVWAVGAYYVAGGGGGTLIEHWNGSTWSVVPSPNASGSFYNYLNGVAVVGPNNVWAVGYYSNLSVSQTLIEHWNGSTWSVVPSPNHSTNDNFLYGVAVTGSNDVWAVGYYYNGGGTPYQTLIEHGNGSTWSIVPSPNQGIYSNFLQGIAMAGSNDVWAVGYYDFGAFGGGGTLIEHWNDSTWSIVPSPNQGGSVDYLYGIGVGGSDDVWAVGDYNNGTANQTLIEHWDGSAWSITSSPNPGASDNYLYGVAVVASNDVWTVGDYSTGMANQTLIERFNPCSPTSTPTRTNTPTDTPTNTPAATLTSTPTPATLLIGHVTWQGPPAQPNVRQQLPITITLCVSGAPVTYATTTDSSGFFTVTTSLPTGSYNWRAKGSRYLATSGTAPLVGGGTTQVEMGQQRAGDVDASHNNIINAVDFNVLKGVFGTASSLGDLNNDGVSNAVDFNLLKNNFGLAGAAVNCP